MIKATSLASLALAALLALSGCSEVKKCKLGTDGCIDEPPTADDTCLAGLELRDGLCVEPSGGGGPGGGGNCNCAIDEICAEDGETCLAYCEPLAELPQARNTPPRCAAVGDQPDLTFQQICANACRQTCLREQAFCTGSTCKLANCDLPTVLAACVAVCPGNNAVCMEEACFELAAETCSDYSCPVGATRNCSSDIKCNDSCASENIADGFCDDGDPLSATYAFCGFGTDCSDCGPRKGSPSARLPLGAACPEGQDVSCQGYNDDYLKTEAWCLRFGAASDPYRCVPDCTTSDGAGRCPDDYECQAVLNSSGQPFRDATANRTPGYACVPIVCE